MTGGYDQTYPRDITFLRNTAVDTRAEGQRRMQYGFRNDLGTANRMANCTSTGHTAASVLGTFAMG